MSDSQPTGRQIEYATALGIEILPGISQEDLSVMIDSAKEQMNSVGPTPGQLAVAQRLCIQIPPTIKNGWECCDLFYEYMPVRAWVYSVLRHVQGADWRRYQESRLAEYAVARVATALMSHKEILTSIQKKTPSEGTAHSDPWYRITPKTIKTPEYALVRNAFPGAKTATTAKAPQSEAGSPAPPPIVPTCPSRPRLQRSSGCLVMLLLGSTVSLAIVLTISLALNLK